MKVLLSIIAVVMAANSYAVDRLTTFRWAPVTQNENNAPITVAGFRIYRMGDGSIREMIAAPSGDQTSYTVTLSYPPGSQCFVLTALDAALVESLESNIACQDWTKPGDIVFRPKAPVNFGIDP
jgi:hypothetical protein